MTKRSLKSPRRSSMPPFLRWFMSLVRGSPKDNLEAELEYQAFMILKPAKLSRQHIRPGWGSQGPQSGSPGFSHTALGCFLTRPQIPSASPPMGPLLGTMIKGGRVILIPSNFILEKAHSVSPETEAHCRCPT